MLPQKQIEYGRGCQRTTSQPPMHININFPKAAKQGMLSNHAIAVLPSCFIRLVPGQRLEFVVDLTVHSVLPVATNLLLRTCPQMFTKSCLSRTTHTTQRHSQHHAAEPVFRILKSDRFYIPFNTNIAQSTKMDLARAPGGDYQKTPSGAAAFHLGTVPGHRNRKIDKIPTEELDRPPEPCHPSS